MVSDSASASLWTVVEPVPALHRSFSVLHLSSPCLEASPSIQFFLHVIGTSPSNIMLYISSRGLLFLRWRSLSSNNKLDDGSLYWTATGDESDAINKRCIANTFGPSLIICQRIWNHLHQQVLDIHWFPCYFQTNKFRSWMHVYVDIPEKGKSKSKSSILHAILKMTCDWLPTTFDSTCFNHHRAIDQATTESNWYMDSNKQKRKHQEINSLSVSLREYDDLQAHMS